MGRKWQLRVLRSDGERVCDPGRGAIHNMHRIKPPGPPPPIAATRFIEREAWVDKQRNTP